MSLIAAAERVHARHAPVRKLLMLVAITVAVIAGLLAMHSLNTHPTTTGHSSAVAVTTADHHDAPTAVTAASSNASHEGCTDCAGDHAMAWMVCVLALLVATVLLWRSFAQWRTPGTNLLIRMPLARGPTSLVLPLPPSLTVLCISRT